MSLFSLKLRLVDTAMVNPSRFERWKRIYPRQHRLQTLNSLTQDHMQNRHLLSQVVAWKNAPCQLFVGPNRGIPPIRKANAHKLNGRSYWTESGLFSQR